MTLITAIRDIKIGYMDPFLQKSEDVAKRSFKTMLNDERNRQIAQYREDMELWVLGTFDETTGEIKPYKNLIMRGEEVEIENK